MANQRKLKIQARLKRKLGIRNRPSGVSANPCPDGEPLGYIVDMPHEGYMPSSLNINSNTDLARLKVRSSYVYPVEVKSAGNMGNGVFVTRDVKEGELLCYYDGICCFNTGDVWTVTGKCGYNQNLPDDNGSIAGFQTQLRPGGCGQLINDASNDLSTYGNDEYWTKINTRGAYLGKANGFYAKRDIRCGEQLFHHYGEDYWKCIETCEDTNNAIKKLPYINMGLEMDDYVQRLRLCSQLRKYANLTAKHL